MLVMLNSCIKKISDINYYNQTNLTSPQAFASVNIYLVLKLPSLILTSTTDTPSD